VVILPVTTIFRPLRLMEPELLAEAHAETVIWFPAVVRIRLLPFANEVALATVITPEVEFVKLTVRLLTKLEGDVPNRNEEFETVPPLSFTRIDASPAGWFMKRLVLVLESPETADPLHMPDVVMV